MAVDTNGPCCVPTYYLIVIPSLKRLALKKKSTSTLFPLPLKTKVGS